MKSRIERAGLVLGGDSGRVDSEATALPVHQGRCFLTTEYAERYGKESEFVALFFRVARCVLWFKDSRRSFSVEQIARRHVVQSPLRLSQMRRAAQAAGCLCVGTPQG